MQTSNGKKVPFAFSSHAFCIRFTSSLCYDKLKLCCFFTRHFLRNIGVILKRKFIDLFQYFVFFWTRDIGCIFFDRKWILNFIALNASAQDMADQKFFPRIWKLHLEELMIWQYCHTYMNLVFFRILLYELNEIYVSALPSLPKILHQINCIVAHDKNSVVPIYTLAAFWLL